LVEKNPKKLPRNETKHNESLKTNVSHITFTSPFKKDPKGFAQPQNQNGHFVRRPSSENPPCHRPVAKAPAEAAVFGSCHRVDVEKPTSLTTFASQVCAYLEV